MVRGGEGRFGGQRREPHLGGVRLGK